MAYSDHYNLSVFCYRGQWRHPLKKWQSFTVMTTSSFSERSDQITCQNTIVTCRDVSLNHHDLTCFNCRHSSISGPSVLFELFKWLAVMKKGLVLLKMIGLVIMPHLLYQKIIYKFQLGHSVGYSSNPLLPFHSGLL